MQTRKVLVPLYRFKVPVSPRSHPERTDHRTPRVQDFGACVSGQAAAQPCPCCMRHNWIFLCHPKLHHDTPSDRPHHDSFRCEALEIQPSATHFRRRGGLTSLCLLDVSSFAPTRRRFRNVARARVEFESPFLQRLRLLRRPLKLLDLPSRSGYSGIVRNSALWTFPSAANECSPHLRRAHHLRFDT